MCILSRNSQDFVQDLEVEWHFTETIVSVIIEGKSKMEIGMQATKIIAVALD